jgi:hypothetical protein
MNNPTDTVGAAVPAANGRLRRLCALFAAGTAASTMRHRFGVTIIQGRIISGCGLLVLGWGDSRVAERLGIATLEV